MGEIAIENGRISDIQGLVTLTLDRVILHTVMHHSSTSPYIPNYVEIEETFCGQMYGWADRHFRPTLLGRLGGVDLIITIAIIFAIVTVKSILLCPSRITLSSQNEQNLNQSC